MYYIHIYIYLFKDSRFKKKDIFTLYCIINDYIVSPSLQGPAQLVLLAQRFGELITEEEVQRVSLGWECLVFKKRTTRDPAMVND